MAVVKQSVAYAADRCRHHSTVSGCAGAASQSAVLTDAGGQHLRRVAYSAPELRFQERPFLDSATSSAQFVSPAVCGLVLTQAQLTPALWSLPSAFFPWGMTSLLSVGCKPW